MQSYLGLILQLFITTLIVYAGIAFIELSFNFKEWPYSRRVALIVAGFLITFFIRGILGLNEKFKKDKNLD
jgi:succinate dehydrogenase/fumarate reductase cytochrome b subunit